MAVITISRGSFSHGQEIAEKVAGTLGYECVSREILVEAAQLFNVSEKKLIQSLNDAPNILERIVHGKERYLEYIKASLLGYARKGNVVYHGHAGHLLLTEIPQVLKVRILAEKDDRISLLQKRENLNREAAAERIENEDKNRIHWTRYLYKEDVNDPKLYDIVINIGNLTIEDACEIICLSARSKNYRITDETKQTIDDLAITNRIQVELKSICEAQIFVKNGEVQVNVAAQKRRKSGYISPALQHHIGEAYQHDVTRQIHEIARKVPGVKDVFCQVDMPYYT
ncbi:MAG: cytidylate kinase-like family protein [Desulfobacterales bacterium]|jgi:cytidylate kinase